MTARVRQDDGHHAERLDTAGNLGDLHGVDEHSAHLGGLIGAAETAADPLVGPPTWAQTGQYRRQVTGREAVMEWLAEDISTSGATIRTSPNREATCAKAAMRGL